MDLKTARQSVGLSLYELADRVGVTAYEIAFFESRMVVTREMHARLMKVLTAAAAKCADPTALQTLIAQDLQARIPGRAESRID